MSAVECLVAIYAILHLIENVNKNCAISLLALIIFIESRIPYFWVLHVTKKYQSVNKLLRMRFRKHEVIHLKKKKKRRAIKAYCKSRILIGKNYVVIQLISQQATQPNFKSNKN